MRTISALCLMLSLIGCADDGLNIADLKQSKILSVEVSCPDLDPVVLSSPDDLEELDKWVDSIEGPLIGSFIGPSGRIELTLKGGAAFGFGCSCYSESDVFGLLYVGDATYVAKYIPDVNLGITLTSKGKGTPAAPLL